MNELKAETRALLELGREGDDPSDEAIDQNRRKLAVRIGAAALGTSVVAGSATKAAAASAVGVWTSAKVIAVCGVVIASGAALGTYALRGEPAAPPAASVVKPSALGASSSVREQQALAADIPPSEPLVPARPEPQSRPSSSAKGEGARSIQSELELIRGAQKHLHRNDARAALALLSEHARRFPSGALAEEREASRVFALCQLGDAAGARSLAERFVRRSPNSPFVERVRASCRSGTR